MDKKKIIENLDLHLIKDDTKPIKLVRTWRDFAIEQVGLLENIAIFLSWYYSDGEELCPYSAVTLNNLAKDILQYYSGAGDDFIDRHRKDYEVLDIICRKGQFISAGYIVELVKVIDYLIEHDMV